MKETPKIAVIGGSGIYDIPELVDRESHEVSTPFGKPSSPLISGSLNGVRLVFLARHGIGHYISPTEVNYRANIYALKAIGVQEVISISACGSLREDYAPGDIVIPDQLMDLTRDRKRTFFEGGLVAHVGVANPFCPELSAQLYSAVQLAGANAHLGGAFVTVEGPRFSTRAESNVFRSWGMAIIGMTTAPEAFLAREAELCYAVMAHVTDYDVWHTTEEAVSVDLVLNVLNKNTRTAQTALNHLVNTVNPQHDCDCHHALANALITQPEKIPAETRQRLGLLVDAYLPKTGQANPLE
jgi:5'-methylthioadenosine phosphorylase